MRNAKEIEDSVPSLNFNPRGGGPQDARMLHKQSETEQMEYVVWERSSVEMGGQNLVEAVTKLVSCKGDKDGLAGRKGKSFPAEGLAHTLGTGVGESKRCR